MKNISQIAERVAGAVEAARGQQTRRKDKDLMRDTGGVSKGRDREPNFKPPRDDVKERYRDRRLVPDKQDKDTNSDADRDVKKPNRNAKVASWTPWTPELVTAYCDAVEFFPQGLRPDKWKVFDVRVSRNRGQPPYICQFQGWGNEPGYVSADGQGVADALNKARIPVPAAFLSAHTKYPLDELKKCLWGDTEAGNYHQQVRICLHHVLEGVRRVSEKDFAGQDGIGAEADRLVRLNGQVVEDFKSAECRPEYCAEAIYDGMNDRAPLGT